MSRSIKFLNVPTNSCGLMALLAARSGCTHTARIAKADTGFDPRSQSADADANLALGRSDQHSDGGSITLGKLVGAGQWGRRRISNSRASWSTKPSPEVSKVANGGAVPHVISAPIFSLHYIS